MGICCSNSNTVLQILIVRLAVMLMLMVVTVVMMIEFTCTLSSLVLNINLFDRQASLVPENVMDWCMWLLEQVSLTEVPLHSLNVSPLVVLLIMIMFMITIILLLISSHVLLNRGNSCRLLILMITFLMLHLCVFHALDEAFDAALLLKDVEAHLEDVMHLELIAEALFLQVCIDVA